MAALGWTAGSSDAEREALQAQLATYIELARAEEPRERQLRTLRTTIAEFARETGVTAGDAAARSLAALSPRKAHRAWLPIGKDLGEFVQVGGVPLGWLRSEFDRLNWTWPLR